MKDKVLTLSTVMDLVKQIKLMLGANPKKKYRLTIVEWKKRSVSINAVQHGFYSEVAKHKGDQSALDIKNFCKDAFGLPILLDSAEHGEKLEFLLNKLDYYRHSHESKMKLIQCLEVTSLFTVKESKEYTDQLIFYFNENGIPIKYKD